MNSRESNPFLNVAEAAEYLRLKKRTLDNMRWMGTGPMFRKHGGRIYYQPQLRLSSHSDCGSDFGFS